PFQFGGVPAGTARQVEHPEPGFPGGNLLHERDRAPRLLLVAMRIEDVVFLSEPLFEPFGHSPKTSASNVETWVPGSRHACGPRPALRQAALRNAVASRP